MRTADSGPRTMALGTIANKLCKMGFVFANHMPEQIRPVTPPKPNTVRVFQISAMMGLMILL